MNPLEAVLRPIASVLNKNILATTPARELCQKLAGTVVAIRVRDTALTAWFIVQDDRLELTTEAELEPDVLISGSIITLAQMAGGSDVSAVRSGSLEFAGDPILADEFRQLLTFAKPDLEEELSVFVGDVAAYRLAEIARGVSKWSRDARNTMAENIREYLQEESRDVPSRYEVEHFTSDVGALRDDVDRLEARIKRLKKG